VADEPRRLDGVLARVVAEEGLRLFLPVVETINLRPLRPGVVRGAAHGRPRHDLQLQDAPAAVPQGRADAVRACVAAADDDDVLILRRDVIAIPMLTV